MKKKLKLMILHNIISPYRNPLFEELSKKYDLMVYFCRENYKEREWSTKLEGYSFKYKILPHKNRGPFAVNSTLRGELEENDFDVYLLVENPENALSIKEIVRFAKKKDKRVILWNERIDDEIYSLKNIKESKNPLNNLIYSTVKSFYSRYRKNLYSKPKSFIAFSDKSARLLVSKGIGRDKIFRTSQIMPESLLPRPSWSEKPEEFKSKKIILYIGYLNERKGVKYLIKAFKQLNRDDAILLIAGTGEDKEKLEALAKENKNIIFIGYKDGIDKSNYYSIADFFVFPTLYDVWGLVVNEAFYYGVPVISTNKAEAKELITNGKTGLIVPNKDSNAFEKAIRKLLNNPKLLKQMRENVRKVSKSKIVDIKTSAKVFEKAINYTMEKN